MKSIIVLAALTLAGGASASDQWLDSVHGTWNCKLPNEEPITSATVSIDSVTSHITVKRNGKVFEGTLVDVTESLTAKQREAGFKLYSLAEDNAHRQIMIKAPDGTLKIEEVGRYIGETFRPDAVCDKAIGPDLTFSGGSSASDLWLESVHGNYNCSLINEDYGASMKIDAVSKHVSITKKGKTFEATMVDESESLTVMEREVGFHQFKFVAEKEKGPTLLMFRTSSGKLLAREMRKSSSANGWELPEFSPDLVCEKANN
jgi:hypothetical protein